MVNHNLADIFVDINSTADKNIHQLIDKIYPYDIKKQDRSHIFRIIDPQSIHDVVQDLEDILYGTEGVLGFHLNIPKKVTVLASELHNLNSLNKINIDLNINQPDIAIDAKEITNLKALEDMAINAEFNQPDIHIDSDELRKGLDKLHNIQINTQHLREYKLDAQPLHKELSTLGNIHITTLPLNALDYGQLLNTSSNILNNLNFVINTTARIDTSEFVSDIKKLSNATIQLKHKNDSVLDAQPFHEGLSTLGNIQINAFPSGIIDYGQLLETSSKILHNLELIKQSTATIDATPLGKELSKISNAKILLEHNRDININANDLHDLNQVNNINIVASESGIIDYSQLLETSSQILNNLEVLKQSTATLDATTMANDLSKISNANILLEHSHDITLDGNELQKLNQVNNTNIVATESDVLNYGDLLEKSSKILHNLEVLKQSTTTLDATSLANDLSKISNANIILEHSHDITLDGNDLQKLNNVNDAVIIASESGIIDYSQLLEKSSNILNNLELLKQSTATIDATTMGKELSIISNANIILEHSHDITLDGNDLQKLNNVNDAVIIASESGIIDYSQLLEKSSNILNNLEVLKQSTATIDATTMANDLSKISNANILLEHSHDITLDGNDLQKLNQVNDINIIASESGIIDYSQLLETSSQILNNLEVLKQSTATLDATTMANDLSKISNANIILEHSHDITLDGNDLQKLNQVNDINIITSESNVLNYSDLLEKSSKILNNLEVLKQSTSTIDATTMGKELSELSNVNIILEHSHDITLDAKDLHDLNQVNNINIITSESNVLNYGDLLEKSSKIINNLVFIRPDVATLDASILENNLQKLNDIHITTNNNANITIDASELKEELGKLIDNNMYVNYSNLLFNANDVLHNINIIGPGTSLLDGSHFGSELQKLNDIHVTTNNNANITIDASELKEELGKLIDNNMYVNYSDLLLNANDVLHNINIIGPGTSLLDGSHFGSELDKLNDIHITTNNNANIIIDASELKKELGKLIDDNMYVNYSDLLLNANDVLHNVNIIGPGTSLLDGSHLGSELKILNNIQINTEHEKDVVIDASELKEELSKLIDDNMYLNYSDLLLNSNDILHNINIIGPDTSLLDGSHLGSELKILNNIQINTEHEKDVVIDASELKEELSKLIDDNIYMNYSNLLLNANDVLKNMLIYKPSTVQINVSELANDLNKISDVSIVTEPEKDDLILQPLFHAASNILNNMIIQIPEKTIIDSSELADNLNKINKINIETLNPGKTIIYSSELADNLNKINNIHIETQYSDKTLIDSSEFINNLNQINNIHIKTQIPEKTTIDSSELMMGLNQINNINIDTQKQVPYFDFSNLLSTASVILNAFEIYKGFNGDYHVLVIFKFVISHTVNKERTKKTYVVKTIKENVINMEDSTEIKKIAKIWKLKKINFGELVVNNSQVDTNNIPKDSETKMVHDKIKNVLTTKDIVTNNYNTMALHVVINRKNNKQNKHIIHSVYVR